MAVRLHVYMGLYTSGYDKYMIFMYCQHTLSSLYEAAGSNVVLLTDITCDIPETTVHVYMWQSQERKDTTGVCILD